MNYIGNVGSRAQIPVVAPLCARLMIGVEALIQNMKRTYANMPYAVFAYQHHNGQNGALVTLESKTDFALRTELVQTMGRKMAMHAAAYGSLHEDAGWLFDGTKTIGAILKELRNELGEPIAVKEVSVHGVHLNSIPIDGYK